MVKLKVKARSARNSVAESASPGHGRGPLSEPHSRLPPDDNASTAAVNEGFPGTAARDFAVPNDPPVRQPVVEPPTSLQSSVDAGTPVPAPPRNANGTGTSQPTSGARRSGRARSNSAPQHRPAVSFRQSSIGIRRIPSAGTLPQPDVNQSPSGNALQGTSSQLRLPALEEEAQLEPVATGLTNSTTSTESSTPQAANRLSQATSAVSAKLGFWKSKKGKGVEGANGQPQSSSAPPPAPEDPGWNYSSNMVDVLDTVDPEVQTLTSLTNIQNSLFVPNLGRFVNRRPTYNFQRALSEEASLEDINRILQPVQEAEEDNAPRLKRAESEGTMATLRTIDSRMSDSRYAVLPHGTTLEGWSKEDKQELNDHVRHMLHSRRSRFKRAMRGFGQYVRRPLGFLVTLYATLITLFGLAWVLFLIGWINVGGRQIYVVHIIDSVLVALFAVVGDGLAPFRVIDTYHMIFIAHYHHYTWSRRKRDRLPELRDHNDLPSSNAPMSGRRDTDPADPEKQWEFTVLTPKQQAKLEHHQAKFCKSHSFYKPHETETHYAFPLRLLVAIVVLLDCHSLLQISLGAVTWGWYYKDRPFAVTTVILCCSITCNATAGLLITIGDHRTRKKDVLERMNRQELTEEAMHHIEKKREKESESEREEEDGSKKGRTSLHLMRHRHSGEKHPNEKGKGKQASEEEAAESESP